MNWLKIDKLFSCILYWLMIISVNSSINISSNALKADILIRFLLWLLFIILCTQVDVLLSCTSNLWQLASLWDNSCVWPHIAEICLPDNAEATTRQISSWEGKNATREEDTCSETFSKVRIDILLAACYTVGCFSAFQTSLEDIANTN